MTQPLWFPVRYINMANLTRCLAAIIVAVAFCAPAKAQTSTDVKATAQVIIKNLFNEVRRLTEGASYPGLASLSGLQWRLEPYVSLDPRDGWLVMGSVSDGVSSQPLVTPGSGALLSRTVYANDNSFALDIFIASGHGDGMVPRTRTFELNRRPQLIIAYSLHTKAKNPLLEKAISRIVESQLTDISQKILAKM